MWTAASQTSRTLAGQVSILRLPLTCSQCPKDQRPDLGRLAPATKANGEARKRIPIERKQITVLFADLKGSMELLSERDPEEARKILDPVLEHMMEAVHGYEGTVNQVMGDLFRVIKERELDQQLHILSMPISPEHLAEMVRMIDQGKISGKIAKALFEELLDSGESTEKIVREKDLEQVSDVSSIETAIDQVLAAHSQQVSDYRSGK